MHPKSEFSLSTTPRASCLRRIAVGVIAMLGATLFACEPAPLPEDDLYVGGAPLPGCVSNNDGVITREEMPFVPGALARIRIGEGPVDVDVTGRVEDDGSRTWDFSRPVPENEPLAFIGASVPDAEWYLDAFSDRGLPAPDLIAPLDPGGETQGPIVLDGDNIRLLGAASTEENPSNGQTLIIYDEPAPLYAFPLEVGARVQQTVRATNATLLGLPVALDDAYDIEVTAIGTMVLPDLILENTLRVTVRLERTLVVGDVRQVTHIYVHECLGEVARVVSDGVPVAETIDDEFESAAQVWRLSL